MTLFKTRYKVRQDDTWMFVLYRRKWWWPIYKPFLNGAIASYSLKAVLSLIPDDGVIV